MTSVIFRRMFSGTMSVGALLIGGSSSFAQDDAWEFSGTFYTFASQTTTTVNTPGGRSFETVLSFSEALQNLDLAFMGTVEARKGRWGLIADYVRTDLSFSDKTPGPVFSGAETDLTSQYLSGYLAYTAFETQRVALDIGAGFRWFDTSTKINVVGGPAPGPSARFADDWIDPLIAARIRFQINDRWSASATADYGGFSGNSQTMQFVASAGYAINDHWSVRGGYRYIEFDRDDNGIDFEVSQSGPVLGIAFRF